MTAADPGSPRPGSLLPGASAVITSWNRKQIVRENLDSLRAQTVKFDEIIVVDNHSNDGTAEMLAAEYPEVRAIAMPHSGFGACETFNIGFKSVKTEFTAILDDDIELPPDWLEKLMLKFAAEPATTAMLSTKVVEPGMPEYLLNSDSVNRERYMATFRGCGTLARTAVLAKAGYYDERFFIYGNERDLASRVLGLGFRVKQFPEVTTYHKTPWGQRKGKRFADATGAIGAFDNINKTPLGWWIVFRATLAAFTVHLPYCLKHRSPVRSPDFELPIK
ncbi:MAG: glycosyltransferase [Planctomycetes bacterium]|nr:glycosyltransferase [Planctomycetota bacterium]